MASLGQTMAFSGIVLLGAMAPGPDLAVIVRRSAIAGRSAGMGAALGIGVGVCGWAFAAATGVAALVAASVTAFTVVKIVGAGYLAFLGIKALRAAARDGDTETPHAAHETGKTRDRGTTSERGPATPVRARGGGWTAFREGLLCNVLNPKCALFYVALMPQFLPGHVQIGATALFSAISLVICTVWFLLVASLVGGLRRLFARPAARRAIDALTGAALIALGLRLAATSRP